MRRRVHVFTCMIREEAYWPGARLAPGQIGLPEQRQNCLRCLVCNRQRLNAQLLLRLQGLQAGRHFFHVRIDKRADPRFERVGQVAHKIGLGFDPVLDRTERGRGTNRLLDQAINRRQCRCRARIRGHIQGGKRAQTTRRSGGAWRTTVLEHSTHINVARSGTCRERQSASSNINGHAVAISTIGGGIKEGAQLVCQPVDHVRLAILSTCDELEITTTRRRAAIRSVDRQPIQCQLVAIARRNRTKGDCCAVATRDGHGRHGISGSSRKAGVGSTNLDRVIGQRLSGHPRTERLRRCWSGRGQILAHNVDLTSCHRTIVVPVERRQDLHIVRAGPIDQVQTVELGSRNNRSDLLGQRRDVLLNCITVNVFLLGGHDATFDVIQQVSDGFRRVCGHCHRAFTQRKAF
mmetsp:Transcript_24275/g.45189  ORF Transcript_24275/g.45189 Transcript_24275/m.45189 type:complete len:406 (-) Transcript_24275:943-2160(-)